MRNRFSTRSIATRGLWVAFLAWGFSAPADTHDDAPAANVRSSRHQAGPRPLVPKHLVPRSTGGAIAPEDAEVATAARGLVGVIQEKGFTPVYGGGRALVTVARGTRVIGVKPSGEKLYLGYDGKMTTAAPTSLSALSTFKGPPATALIQSVPLAPVTLPDLPKRAPAALPVSAPAPQIRAESPAPFQLPQVPTGSLSSSTTGGAPLAGSSGSASPGGNPAGPSGAPAGSAGGTSPLAAELGRELGRGGGSRHGSPRGATDYAPSAAGGETTFPISVAAGDGAAFGYGQQPGGAARASAPTGQDPRSPARTPQATPTPTVRRPPASPTPTPTPISLEELPPPSGANPLIHALNKFGLQVLNQLPSRGNRLLSPTSLYLPTVMIFLGSDVDTKKKLRQKLGLPDVPDATLAAWARDLLRSPTAKDWSTVAGGVFAGQKVKLRQTYVDLMQSLGAKTGTAPDVDEWLRDNLPGTGASMPAPESDQIVVAGATGIKAHWAGEYRKAMVDFNGGSTPGFESAKGVAHIQYQKDGRTYDAVRMPLAQSDPKKPRYMILEMGPPGEAPPEFDGSRVTSMSYALATTKRGTKVTVPKVDMKSDDDLDPAIGAVLGNDWKSGLGSQMGTKASRVETVRQTTALEVDDLGVKGWAVTRYSARLLARDPDWPTTKFDRPFNFYIMEGDPMGDPVCLMAGQQKVPNAR